jgi:capsular exopolysaccharide synthesis family protein
MNKDKKRNDEDNSLVDIQEIFSKLVFHWPLFLLLVIISSFGAYLYLKYTRPIFSSSGKILIKDERGRGGGASGFDNLNMFNNTKIVENEMEVIKSPLILENVIRENKFNIRYYLKGKVVNKELYQTSPIEVQVLTDSSRVGSYSLKIDLLSGKAKVTYPEFYKGEKFRSVVVGFEQPFQIKKDKFSIHYNPQLNVNRDEEFEVRIDSIIPLVYAKSKEIKTELVNRMGSVFELSYEDENPKRAADFLNAVLNAYNEYTLSDKNKITLNTIRFIEGRLASLGDELNVLERDVEGFKKSKGITEIGESSRLILEQAREADQRLTQANIQLQVYNQIENYLQSNSTNPFTPLYGPVDGALAGLIARYQDAIREKSRLSLSVKEGNPILEDVDNQITETRKSIKAYIEGYRRNSATEKAGLESKVRRVESQISEVPTIEREFINIKRQQSVKEGLYNFLLQRREESSVAYASNIIDNKIISPAYIPYGPIKPKRTSVYLFFIAGGLVLAIAYIQLKYLINNRINTKKDIKEVTEIPIIGEVYRQEESGSRKINLNERTVLSEQILNLKNNLKFILNEVKHSPAIMFTSSISGEGKTFISTHLGNAFTSNNKKVVLMELDLRKPKLSQSLGMSNAIGLTNYLVGSIQYDQMLKHIPENPNLFLIPSGPVPPNPVELIESEKMKELFVMLRERFDYIIIDTSPVGMVSDAKSLSPFIDCSLFVTRFNYTPKPKFRELMSDIDKTVFHKPNIIFNGVDLETSYGYSTYGYSNYGYGYGNTSPNVGLFSTFMRGLKHRLF